MNGAIRAAGSRHDERGDPLCALEGCLEVANTGDTPAVGATIRDHHRVFGQHRDERVEVPGGCGLRECRKQSPMHVRRRGEQALLCRHVLSRTLEELSAGRLSFLDERRDLLVIEVEDVPKQSCRRRGYDRHSRGR